jgi:hypothetical protein
MNQQHDWADDDRRQIAQFLRTSARYLGLSPCAKVAAAHPGARPPALPPRMPWPEVVEAPRAIGR